MIYQRYQIRDIGFYWLVAELDKRKNLAFGYANLNDDQLAEWGYIDIDELLENGAELDRELKPCAYKEAIDKISNEREQRRLQSKYLSEQRKTEKTTLDNEENTA